MTATATDTIQTLSSEIQHELDDALHLLKENLNRVESELDLECANLRDLVSQRNPEIQKQIDALGASIYELHRSLRDVREKLGTAHEDSCELKSVTHYQSEETITPFPSTDEAKTEPEEALSPQQASRIRHDEKITLGGIFRALFMAEEPGQRFVKPPKD